TTKRFQSLPLLAEDFHLFRVAVFVVLCFQIVAARAENWPGWRGPRGDGASLETNVPTQWNGETGLNLAWKVPVPGGGHASPIVWDDRVFLVACVDRTEERILACLDRRNGKLLWQRTVIRSPLE